MAYSTGQDGQTERVGCFQKLKKAAKRLKRNVYALHLAIQDPAVGWASRAIGIFVVAYALSPLDLIPDFIPVLGILDDLILLPGLIWLAIRLIPTDVWEHAVARAEVEPLRLGDKWAAALVILVIWDTLLLGAMYWAVVHFSSERWQRYAYAWVALAAGLLVLTEGSWAYLRLRHERQSPAAAAGQTDVSVEEALLTEQDDV